MKPEIFRYEEVVSAVIEHGPGGLLKVRSPAKVSILEPCDEILETCKLKVRFVSRVIWGPCILISLSPVALGVSSHASVRSWEC